MDMSELANKVSNLRYDALAEFLLKLSANIIADAKKDLVKKRYKLSSKLNEASHFINMSSHSMRIVDDICKKATSS